jgi:hypothetical protein
MRRTVSCCKDCPDRVLHCHSTCERYILEQEEYQKKKAEVMKQYGMQLEIEKTLRQGNARRSRIRNRKK